MEGDMGISINNLEARRTIALRTVLSNILSISHTVETYAGITDGQHNCYYLPWNHGPPIPKTGLWTS